ncbi:hypothetical protein D3C80_1652750 [compost metagenome]
MSRVRVSLGASTPSWQPRKSRKYSETFLPPLPLISEMYCFEVLLLRHSEMLMRAARCSWPRSRCLAGVTSRLSVTATPSLWCSRAMAR